MSTGELFIISRNYLALGGTVPPQSTRPDVFNAGVSRVQKIKLVLMISKVSLTCFLSVFYNKINILSLRVWVLLRHFENDAIVYCLLLWIELCPPQIHMLKSTPQYLRLDLIWK